MEEFKNIENLILVLPRKDDKEQNVLFEFYEKCQKLCHETNEKMQN